MGIFKGLKGKKIGKKALGVLQSVAPTIALALGGPLAGAAVQQLSVALTGGKDTDEAQMDAMIAGGDYDTVLALKQAEHDFEIKMAEMEITQDQLVFQDIDSARQRHIQVKDKEPARLAYLAMITFGVLVGLVLTQQETFSGSEFATVIVSTIIGASIGWVDKAYNFFLGSSRGSKDKSDAMIRAIGEFKKQ